MRGAANADWVGVATVGAVIRGRNAVAVVGTIVILALGCTSTSEETAAVDYPPDFVPIGRTRAPTRPLMPSDLPEGWRITSRDLRDEEFGSAMQSLFMPPGSTPEQGPAVVVGFVGDEQYAPHWCDPPAPYGEPLPPGIVRWGDGLSLMEIDGPDSFTSNGAYVLGRDIDDAVLARAASTVRWGGLEDAPMVELPARYRLRATSHLDVRGDAWLAMQEIEAPDGLVFVVGQEEDTTAGVFLADFWRNTASGQTCRGYTGADEADLAVTTIIREHTVVRVRAHASRAGRRGVEVIERSLRRVSRRAYCGTVSPGPGDPPWTCSPLRD